MTALLEFKQKLKGWYGRLEIYLQPLLKFVIALLYFIWINENMGYMQQINNVFIVLILALICSILPFGVMVFSGCVLMIMHAYALGMEVAGFMLVLILFMLILFLRFSAGQNIVMVLTPLSFAFDVPLLLPIGCGLLGTAVSALPAGCGVIFYYFIRFLGQQADVLQGESLEMMGKLTLLSDGLLRNWPMWINLAAFVLVTLVVNLIRTRAFDYAWRIAIIAGGLTYILVILAGGYYLNVQVLITPLLIIAGAAVVIGLILEFFVFGGDYTRAERLEYEDDEYYYYVKAVPKATVATSERSIKKINAEPVKDEKKSDDPVVSFVTPMFHGEEKKSKSEEPAVEEEATPVEKADMDHIDFEKKLEESLKDL